MAHFLCHLGCSHFGALLLDFYFTENREPFRTDLENKNYQRFMLDGINKYLGTNFSHDDIDEVYTYLGNRCNHAKTLLFIESGYDVRILPMRLEG